MLAHAVDCVSAFPRALERAFDGHSGVVRQAANPLALVIPWGCALASLLFLILNCGRIGKTYSEGGFGAYTPCTRAVRGGLRPT